MLYAIDSIPSSSPKRCTRPLMSDGVPQVVISSEHLANTQKQLKSRRLWGDAIYTDDSDLVAALVHQGYYHLSAIHPPGAVQELRITLQLLPPQDGYTSCYRNQLRSRYWCAPYDGCSYSVSHRKLAIPSGSRVLVEGLTATQSISAPLFFKRGTRAA